MKVVHLCLACFFPDGFSYQENMLPKFHKELGYEVEVIASLVTFDKNGKGTYMEGAADYRNEYDIPVHRLEYKKPNFLYKKLNRFVALEEKLMKAAPDILFIHGCQFLDMNVIVKYLKQHPNVKVYVDNHADFSNSATNFISKNLLHKFLWKKQAHKIEPFVTKFYGVLPARVDFLKNIYNLPEDKVELLVMGADDEKVKEASDKENKYALRHSLGFNEDDFVIITGGKIDPAKKQTFLLMEAVAKIENVKLLIYGSVVEEMQEEFEERRRTCNRIKYIGWIKPEDTYKYNAISDLAVYPGRHSVLWEQTAGQGIPMICKYWDGTTHIDMGGNVVFLYKDTAEEIQAAIEKVMADYKNIKEKANTEGRKNFSYLEIAKKAIE